ncbi:MAG: zinc ABC transporter substrate-binding protein [Acidimicrobiaceae bacterium]|jgi:zinc/manganese transport system substrate-binding protein|nr:zinc ABC transporter substrate-binding protein [Acidimicrobiaceae bacterium]
MRSPFRFLAAVLASAAVVLAGCGSGQGADGASGANRPTVVVTTNILGNVVENLVGDELQVVTIMPVGSDPHEFQASAQQVAQIGAAHGVIANGAEFEEGLLDVIESAAADGVPIFEAIDGVETIEFGGGHPNEHGDEHDEHDDEHGHEGVDPHFFTDPSRMARAADGIVAFLIANVDGVDARALEANAASYIAELESLDAEVETLLAKIPSDQRVLVTNHEVFGYFADRYGFEVAGTIIPSGSTTDGADAKALAELAELIEHQGVPAIFAETSSSAELASTLAEEVGGIDVIELFSESLGSDDSGGATYVDMVRTNANRIADALAG